MSFGKSKRLCGMVPSILFTPRSKQVISVTLMSIGRVPASINDDNFIAIGRRYCNVEESEPHVTPLKEHHLGGVDKSTYVDGSAVVHEVSPLLNSLPVTTFIYV